MLPVIEIERQKNSFLLALANAGMFFIWFGESIGCKMQLENTLVHCA